MANDDTLLDVQNTPHSSQNRSWFQRTFGPMKKGSLRTSVILLTTSAMGSGMLGIPCIHFFII